MRNVLERCMALDLELVNATVREKLAWTSEKIDRTEKQYRRFLALCAEHTDEVICTADIDDYWEIHIQDTRKYAKDMQFALGFFLHHTPHYLRRNPCVTKDDLLARFDNTLALYEREFGEPIEFAKLAMCPDCAPDYDPPSPPPPRAPSSHAYN